MSSFTKRLLPKSDWRIKMSGPRHVIAGIWEYPAGYRFWEKLALADLPNDFLGIDDLERFGIVLDVSDVPTIAQSQGF